MQLHLHIKREIRVLVFLAPTHTSATQGHTTEAGSPLWDINLQLGCGYRENYSHPLPHQHRREGARTGAPVGGEVAQEWWWGSDRGGSVTTDPPSDREKMAAPLPSTFSIVPVSLLDWGVCYR